MTTEPGPSEGATLGFVHDLTEVEVRVLGCLVEKESTTPDNYPLSTNSLTSACNQKTSRDPVMSLKAAEVDAALLGLRERKMVRAVHVQGARATKHRHVFAEAVGVDQAELAVLAVLFLRSAQTPGELRGRCERIHEFETTGEVEAVLQRLAMRGAVRELARQPGQSATRWEHLASSDHESESSVVADVATGAAETQRPADVAAPIAPATVVAEPLRSTADQPVASSAEQLRSDLDRLTARFEALESKFQSLCDRLGEHPG